MGVQLVDENNNAVSISTMQDGEMAIVLSDPTDVANFLVGKIVQRYGVHLVQIGNQYSHGWDEAFGSDAVSKRVLVRILQPGETIEITE